MSHADRQNKGYNAKTSKLTSSTLYRKRLYGRVADKMVIKIFNDILTK